MSGGSNQRSGSLSRAEKLHKTYLLLRIISRAKELQFVFAFNYARQTILYYPAKKQSNSWICEGIGFMRRSVLIITSAMKSICGLLFWNCTAIKSTFHRAMKRNGRNSDCKGKWRHAIRCVYAFSIPTMLYYLCCSGDSVTNLWDVSNHVLMHK